jgi:hypothetical protein
MAALNKNEKPQSNGNGNNNPVPTCCSNIASAFGTRETEKVPENL